MYDFSDVEPQQSSELIPDGTFAKVTMTIRPGGVDGQTEIDRGLLKASTTPGSDVLSLDCEFTVTEGRARPAQVLADASRSRAARSTRRAPRSAGTSPSAPSAR